MKLGFFFGKIFEKYSNINFGENPTFGIDFFFMWTERQTDRQRGRRTDRHDEADIAFRSFANAPKMWKYFLLNSPHTSLVTVSAP